MKHRLMEKSPALSSHEHDMVHQASRLGDVVAKACLSVARMVRVEEKTHNSKTTEALLVRQHLEKVSAKAINSVMDEIQGAHTPAEMWQVEKQISTHISCERAKAYGALVSNTTPCPIISQEGMVQVTGPLRWWVWRKSSASPYVI